MEMRMRLEYSYRFIYVLIFDLKHRVLVILMSNVVKIEIIDRIVTNSQNREIITQITYFTFLNK